MKRIAILILLLAAVAGAARADDNAVFIEGQGILIPSERTNPCPGSTLYQNHDGSIENAFTWQLQGVVAPDYGAFAEGYAEIDWVCGVQLWLTRWSTMTGNGTIDLYVWEYAAGNPGAVLNVCPNLQVSGVGYWPDVTQIDFGVDYLQGDGFFVGYWPGSFAGQYAQFGCAMDQTGFGGAPRTNIAPGIGYPTGWNHPSTAGYPLQAFGINAYVGGGVIGGEGCSSPPPQSDIDDNGGGEVRAASWSEVKQLYR